MLVDTHCHVFWEYYEDLEQVMTRAKDKGVGALMVMICLLIRKY